MEPPPHVSYGGQGHGSHGTQRQTLPQQTTPTTATEERDFNQLIAQKMLTALSPPTEGGHEAWPHRGTPGRPPWEAEAGAIPNQTPLQRPLRPLQPAAHADASYATLSTAPEHAHAIVDRHTVVAPSSPPAFFAHKNVTFGTKDQIHWWDEQRDVLMYVDEEFFAVARLLIDVVGVDPANVDEYARAAAEPTDAPTPGHGLLARFFGCALGGEVAAEPVQPRPRLTEKFVRDFHAALEFRAAQLAADPASDDATARRVREVARKVAAYGLPLLPSSRTAVGDPAALRAKEKEDDEKEAKEASLLTFNQKTDRQFFPVLPICDDDDDENNPSLAKQILQANPHDSKYSLKNAMPKSMYSSLNKMKSATPSEEDCETRLVQIRSEILKAQQMVDNITNKAVQAACRKRVASLTDERRFFQIIQERHKIQAMMEATGVPIVRAACKQRIGQLIAELQSLSYGPCARAADDGEGPEAEAAGTPACAAPPCDTGPTGPPCAPPNQYRVDDAVARAAGAPACDPGLAGPPYAPPDRYRKDGAAARAAVAPACDTDLTGPLCEPGIPPWRPEAPVGETTTAAAALGAAACGADDDHWYDRVLRYVGEQPLHEEMAVARGARGGASLLAPAQAARAAPPQHGSQVSFAESTYRPPGSDDHRGRGTEALRELSPHAPGATAGADRDGQWFERVLQYVTGESPVTAKQRPLGKKR